MPKNAGEPVNALSELTLNDLDQIAGGMGELPTKKPAASTSESSRKKTKKKAPVAGEPDKI